MDNSDLHMQTRVRPEELESFELPTIGCNLTAIDQRVQRAAQTAQLAPPAASSKAPLRVLHLPLATMSGSSSVHAMRPATLRSMAVAEQALPSTRRAQAPPQACTSLPPLAPSLVGASSSTPRARGVSLTRGTVSTPRASAPPAPSQATPKSPDAAAVSQAIPRPPGAAPRGRASPRAAALAEKKPPEASSPPSRGASVSPSSSRSAASLASAAASAPQLLSHIRKSRGLDFANDSPSAQFQASLRADSVSSEAVKPTSGGNGTTRFLGGLVVKGDDLETSEREMAFSRILRHFGVETPQVQPIAPAAKEALLAAIPDYKKLMESSSPKQILLMPQVKGATAEEFFLQPDLLVKLQTAAPRLLESMGHMAAIDLLLSNNDRLVRVDRTTRELENLNIINPGNWMFTLEHGEVGVVVAIDNAGYNNLGDSELQELDIRQFLRHLQEPEKVAEHIMKGLARDLVWGTLSPKMRHAAQVENKAHDLGFATTQALLDALHNNSEIDGIYTKVRQLQREQDPDSDEATIEPTSNPSEQLEAILQFFDAASLEECKRNFQGAARDLAQLRPYFEGPFEVLMAASKDNDPKVLPLQIALTAKYLGFSSSEQMKQSLVSGLQRGHEAMRSSQSQIFFETLQQESRAFASENIDQLRHIQAKLARLQGRA